MDPSAHAFTSTNHFSKSYLSKAWEARSALTEPERRGFAQFAYLTICGHLEARLAQIVKTRMLFIRTFVHWNQTPALVWQTDSVPATYPIDTYIDSVMLLAAATELEADNAPLSKLTELYDRLFRTTFR